MIVEVDTAADSTDDGFKLDLTIFDNRNSKADEGIREVSTDALIVWCFFSLELEAVNNSRFVKELVIWFSELHVSARLTVDLSGNSRTYEELERAKNAADDFITIVVVKNL